MPSVQHGTKHYTAAEIASLGSGEGLTDPWDEATGDHQLAGSFGEEVTTILETVDNMGTPPTAAANSDAVWDEQIGDHAAAGSTGKALADALTDVDKRVAGRMQIFKKSVDLSTRGPSYTMTAQAEVVVEAIIVRARSDFSTEASFTGVDFKDTGSTPHTFVDSAHNGAKANLTADGYASWEGHHICVAGYILYLSRIGAVGSSKYVDIYVMFRSVADGGYFL